LKATALEPAVAPAAGDADAAGNDRRDLTKFCDERSPEATDLPIARIGQAVQPTSVQRPAFDELKDASVKAAEGCRLSLNASSENDFDKAFAALARQRAGAVLITGDALLPRSKGAVTH
jgi:hypothetical protein